VQSNSQTINNNTKQSRVTRHFPAEVVEVTDEMLANHCFRIAPFFSPGRVDFLVIPERRRETGQRLGPAADTLFSPNSLPIVIPHLQLVAASPTAPSPSPTQSCGPPLTCARPHCLILRPAHFDGRLPLTRRPKARTRHPGTHRHHPSCRLHHLIERA
jgi:hypothetical protein